MTMWCGQDHEHEAIVASEPGCGCVGALHVLTHSEAAAYRMAAEEAASGMDVRTLSVEDTRVMPWTCPDHRPSGPPWWKSNGGNGKRPVATGRPG